MWVGDEPTPRANEAVSALREAGKRVCFVTNDARRSTEDYVRKLYETRAWAPETTRARTRPHGPMWPSAPHDL